MRLPILIILLLSSLQLKAANKLTVTVDERIELVTTIQLLADYPYLTEGKIAYKQEIADVFSAYKNHEAVQYYKAISGWFYGSPPLSYILHFSLPGFRQVVPFNNEDSTSFRYAEKRDSLQQFIVLMKDFYEKSQFHNFYTTHKGYYDLIASPVNKMARSKDFAGIMEKHFGSKNAGYRIILSPLQMDAGFGPMLAAKEGNILCAIVGPRYDSKDMPEFDSETLFRELVIHEFSHSFCNPLIDSFYPQLEKDSCLFTAIKKAMKEQGYYNWQGCLEELLTRANEIVLNKLIFGKADADKLYQQNITDSWIYLEGLVPIVEKEYLPRRSKYPTLKPLMPVVISYFDKEAMKCK